MKQLRVSGPLVIEPIPDDGEEGSRLIVVQVSPFERLEIPVPKQLAHEFIAPMLTMTDEELVAKLTADREAEEARSRIQLPNGAQAAPNQ